MPHKQKVLVLSPVPPELRSRLGALYELVDDAAPGPSAPMPGFRIALTTSMGGASAETMAALPDLRLIACNGTGLERIDLIEAARRRVIVCNTPNVVTDDTADCAIALIYAASRRVAEADRFVRAGRWSKERMTPSRRVTGKTLGVVGLGRIGATIARRAEGVGMRVMYSGPREKPKAPYFYVANVAELAGLVDVLVLSCPGGKSTDKLVGTEILRRLGPEGILVNVSRGSVVDEEALIEALSNGGIAGAGLDVFAAEPELDPRFLALENVVLQPHIAAVTKETRAAMADLLERAIADFLAGRPVHDAAADAP